MSRPIWILLLAGGSTLLTVSCAAGPEFRDRAVATIPEGVRVDVPVAFSQDGLHAVYAERSPESARMVRGEWKGKAFDSL